MDGIISFLNVSWFCITRTLLLEVFLESRFGYFCHAEMNVQIVIRLMYLFIRIKWKNTKILLRLRKSILGILLPDYLLIMLLLQEQSTMLHLTLFMWLKRCFPLIVKWFTQYGINQYCHSFWQNLGTSMTSICCVQYYVQLSYNQIHFQIDYPCILVIVFSSALFF